MIFSLLIIDFFGPLTYLKFTRPQQAEAAWFDDAWGFRKPVNITNASGGILTDFQVSFTIDTTDTTRFQTNCNDIRVTDTNGKLLPHWFEGPCGNASSTVWTKIPSISTTGTTLYVYYGNSTAINTSSTTKVFIREISDVYASWNMNENTSTAINDTSGNGYTGTFAAADATPTWTTGYVGSGVNFDGINDYLRTANLTGTITLPISLSFWVKSQQTSISGAYDSAPSQGNVLRLYDGEGGIQWWNNTSASVSVTTDTWTHIAIVYRYDGTNRIIEWYKNGVFQTKAQTASANTIAWSTFTLGTINTTSTPLKGILDEFKIYKAHTLTQDEVTDIKNNIGYTTTNYPGKELIRKLAATPPTVSTGTEQIGTGPVAYWKFDEGQGQTENDSSSNRSSGVSGTTTSGEASDPTWQTENQCVSGKCMSFDGGDKITVNDPANGSLDFGTSTNFTVSVWAKVQNPTSYHSFLGKGGQDYNGPGYEFFIQNSTIFFRMTWTGGPQWGVDTTTTYDIRDNNWHHIVAVVSRTNNRVYLYGDGKLLNGTGTDISTVGDINNSSALTIGMAGAGYWKGFIDEIKIYPYARSLAQIRADYASKGTDKGVSAVMGIDSGSKAGMTLSNGLVGYWKMDEATWSGTAAEVVDSSGNGNNGVATGAANDMPYTLGGKFGNGGKFDGVNDNVDLGTSSLLNPTTAISVSMWIKRMGTQIDTYNTLLEKDINASWGLFFYQSTNKIWWGGKLGGSAQCGVTGGTALPDSTWVHVVATYDGTILKVYRNGALDMSSTSCSGSIATDAAHVYIGGRASSNRFGGQIDETRIYNRALSPSEVSQIYNWAPGPVAYWNFDEGSGGTVYDTAASASANPGSWNGSGTNRYATGMFGKAGKFNGSDDLVTITETQALRPKQSLTLETWVKFNSVATVNMRFLSKAYQTGQWNSPYVNYELNLDHNGSTPYFTFRTSQGNTNTSGILSPDINTWYHVAGVYDGSTMKIYINGVQKNSANITGDINYGYSTPLEFGRMTTSGYLNGYLDDIKIYNYARSSKQIVEDMNAGHPAGGSPVGSQVGYWNFDEGQGTTVNDSSLSQSNGTFGTSTAAPSWTNEGKFGKALSFDGGDYVSMGDPSALEMTTQFTISSWIYPTDVANYRQIVSKFGSSGNYAYQYGLAPTGNLRTDISGNGTAYDYLATTTSPLTTNTWNHVVVTFNSGDLSIFVNGKRVANKISTITSIYSTGSTNVNVGRDPAAIQYFSGLIDEVKIYNSALTADEIKIDYNQGSALTLGTLGASITDGKTASNSASSQYCVPGDTSTCRAPVGEWLMDEGQGGSINDTSGNNYSGTWSGTGSRYTQGKFGKAARFNGTDDYAYLTNPSFTDFPAGQDFTLEYWINPKVNALKGIIGNKIVTDNSTGWVMLNLGSGQQYFKIGNGSTNISTTVTTAPLNTWSHIAITVNRDGNCLGYLNGVNTATVDCSGTNGWDLTNNNDLRIGRDIDGNYSQLDLDQVRIYNYTRTPAQVAYDYNRGGPVGYWAFDECQGNTLNDTNPGANTNNGTLNIGATVPQSVIGTCTTPTDGSGAWYDGKDGKYNSAMSFDGVDDYVIVNSSNYKFSSGDFSASVWAIKTDTGYGGLITTDSGGDVAWKIFLDNGHTYFSARYGTKILDFLPVNLVDWHHYVITKSGTTLSLYQDSKLVISDTCPATYAGGSSNMVFGSYRVDDAASALNMFKGLIDDVQIFNYALTPLQVTQIYNQNAGVRFGPLTGSP